MCKNSLGSMVFSGIFPILTAISSLHIETLAVLKGLELVAAFQIPRICIETDCVGVIHSIRNMSMVKSTIGHYLNKIHKRMGHLDYVSFLFIIHSLNFY